MLEPPQYGYSNIQSTVKSYTLDMNVTFSIRLIDINEQKPFKTTHYDSQNTIHPVRNINFWNSYCFEDIYIQ